MHLPAAAALLLVSLAAARVQAAPQPLPDEVSDVQWHVATTIFGDFTCRGLQDVAMFGVSEKSGFVVVVQPRGKASKASYLSFASRGRDPANMRLTAESLDLSNDEESKRQQEYLPRDLKASKTCKGLAFGDGETDSHHIYWSRDKKVLRAWSL